MVDGPAGPAGGRSSGGRSTGRRRARLAADGRRLETADAMLAASPPLPPRRRWDRAGLRGGADGRRTGARARASSTPPTCRGRCLRWPPPIWPASGRRCSTCPGRRPIWRRQIGTAVIDRGIEHLLRIIDQTGCRVIMDHHAVRDAAYPRALPTAVGDRARDDRRRVPRPRGHAARGAPARALARTAQAADAGAAFAGPWGGRGRRLQAARARDVRSPAEAAAGEGGLRG